MPKPSDLLQGTLDLLILKTLAREPMHGWGIAKRIQLLSGEVLSVQQGSLYPALHRLEKKGLVASKWAMSTDRNRELRVYRLTAKGKTQLLREESRWKQITEAIARLMWPADAGRTR